ncbi:MAG: zf-HC2 domain-containing protein [Gemmatimonadota bacterium]
MSERHRHLSAERMQALLDGEFPAREASALRSEIAACARCSAEFEAWETLFDDLGELPAFEPSVHFGDRVMDQLSIPARRPALAGLLVKDAPGHATPEQMLEHLDGRLAARTSVRLEEHLEACAACRGEMEGYHSLLSRLDGLQEFAPSPGFGEAVMASVRIQQMAAVVMAPTTRSGRIVSWVREHLPSSSRGWAAALGVGTVPAVIAALVIHTVFSFEQMTLGSLLSFVGFKLSTLGSGMTAWLQGWIGSTPVLTRSLDVLQALSASPTMLAAAAVLSSATVLGAAWILYRNLIVPTGEEGRYAQVSF